MDAALKEQKFEDVNLDDPFFDSLKNDYGGFERWFVDKRGATAITFYDDTERLAGFLYLKQEDGEVTDVEPKLGAAKRLKIGTFKIDSHGTRLGERFMKRAFDRAIEMNAEALYVTVFKEHETLVSLFARYGFKQVAVKRQPNGREELVLERRFADVVGDVVLDYPRIPIAAKRHFVLSLYPKWHSRLLPDSILNNEDISILEDVSHTNSIHKIYLAAMTGVDQLQRGDTLLIYRTAMNGPAFYTSVITSVCVVESLTHLSRFASEEEFLNFCRSYSIFTESELQGFYQSGRYPWLIRFTYNLALTKRVTRQQLIEHVGLDASMYFGFFPITTKQFASILKRSTDYEKARALVHSSPLR